MFRGYFKIMWQGNAVYSGNTNDKATWKEAWEVVTYIAYQQIQAVPTYQIEDITFHIDITIEHSGKSS